MTCVVVPAVPVCWRTRRLRVDQRSSAGFPSRFFTSASDSPAPRAVHQRRSESRRAARAAPPEFRIDTVPEEDQRREQRQRVHPQRSLGKEDTPQLDPERSSTPAASMPGEGGTFAHDSPPIRYSYSASTFSSAGSTLSIRWPSSAIRPSARASCSRSGSSTAGPSGRRSAGSR